MLLRLADTPPPQHNNRSITQRTQIHTHTQIRCNSNWHFTRTSFRARIRNCIQRPGYTVNDGTTQTCQMRNARAMLANIFVNGQRLRQCYGRCLSVLQHVARRACSPLITACLGRACGDFGAVHEKLYALGQSARLQSAEFNSLT